MGSYGQTVRRDQVEKRRLRALSRGNRNEPKASGFLLDRGSRADWQKPSSSNSKSEKEHSVRRRQHINVKGGRTDRRLARARVHRSRRLS